MHFHSISDTERYASSAKILVSFACLDVLVGVPRQGFCQMNSMKDAMTGAGQKLRGAGGPDCPAAAPLTCAAPRNLPPPSLVCAPCQSLAELHSAVGMRPPLLRGCLLPALPLQNADMARPAAPAASTALRPPS